MSGNECLGTEKMVDGFIKSIIVIIIETVKHNVSVRFFTSCGESESSKIVLKSTRKKKNKNKSKNNNNNNNNNNNETSYNVH